MAWGIAGLIGGRASFSYVLGTGISWGHGVVPDVYISVTSENRSMVNLSEAPSIRI